MSLHLLKSEFVRTGLGTVHYVRVGKGAPLFLIHGGHGSWRHWHANLLSLARQHAVFALDMPGYGYSADTKADSTADEVARSVWDAIMSIRATLPGSGREHPVGVAGFSFGAIVAARVALQAQEEIQAVLLINPPGLGKTSSVVREIQAQAANTAHSLGLRAGVAVTLRELMLCRPERASEEALDLLEQSVRDTRFLSRGLSRSEQLLPVLRTLRMPVHVVLGENDPHQVHELAVRTSQLQDVLGRGSVSIFADAAHWLQYDQPDRFNELALSFFDCTGRTRLVEQ